MQLTLRPLVREHWYDHRRSKLGPRSLIVSTFWDDLAVTFALSTSAVGCGSTSTRKQIFTVINSMNNEIAQKCQSFDQSSCYARLLICCGWFQAVASRDVTHTICRSHYTFIALGHVTWRHAYDLPFVLYIYCIGYCLNVRPKLHRFKADCIMSRICCHSLHWNTGSMSKAKLHRLIGQAISNTVRNNSHPRGLESSDKRQVLAGRC